MKQRYSNPKWWTEENDSAWDRTKAALKRDWDQTKHDFGGDEPETNQNVDDTVKQAAGKQAIPPRGQFNEEVEAAHRFGWGAHSHYRTEYPDWNPEAEKRLKQEWTELYPGRGDKWNEDREAIHYGWDYDATGLDSESEEDEPIQ